MKVEVLDAVKRKIPNPRWESNPDHLTSVEN
jgi:hypothetical protein